MRIVTSGNRDVNLKENEERDIRTLEDSQMLEMKVKADSKKMPSIWFGQQERCI